MCVASAFEMIDANGAALKPALKLSQTLLPNGFHDLLGQHLATREQVTSLMMARLETFGYQRVSPPAY